MATDSDEGWEAQLVRRVTAARERRAQGTADDAAPEPVEDDGDDPPHPRMSTSRGAESSQPDGDRP
jgi:hypothetical protein